MPEPYTRPAFALDEIHSRILNEVASSPACTINHVVQQLLPKHGEYGVRNKVHQLLMQRYLTEVKGCHGIQLRITGKGRTAIDPATAG